MLSAFARCACAAVVCLLLLGASPSPSPVAAVDPKIEALAKAWIMHLETGTVDRSQLSARSNAIATPAFLKESAKQFGSMGPLTAFSFRGRQSVIGPHTHQRYTVYTFLATFKRGRFDWQMALDEHGKIGSLLIAPYVQHFHLSERPLIAALRTKLQQDSAAGRFSGAALLAKDGVPVFEQAYGLADRAKKIPNTLNTRFRLGSMNKMFTAVAVMQLVQAGKIDLQKPFGTYLPDYPNKELASKATIHELLTHTGGTGDFFGPQFDKHRLQLRTLDDYVKLYGKRGFVSPQGAYQYSNYGYILLGVVIEKVSGQSYYDYVREHVYDPAGMTSTGSQPEDQTVPGRSIGYTGEPGKEHPNTGTLPYRGTSAGGGYSTVGDLLRFANALQANKLLDAAHTRLLLTGKVDMPSLPDNPRRYAYGFADQRINGIRCFGHDGGAPGMSGDLDICPGPGYVIAVLANIDPPAADQISGFVMNRLPLK
ncbi:MAG TPA: serine hydrolase domain-containing protein [Candidatus Baltobacteraceae bacterium]|nr:serine hydrolase domain-containing protein [Candidatus Baltobacteraceae bacterium]